MNAQYVLTDLIDRNAFNPLTRDRTAFRMHEDSLSFAQLQHSYRQLSHGLQQLGIRKGDRVAIYLGNRLEWIELLFAIASAGAVSVPLNVMLSVSEVEQVLSDNPMAMLITDESTAAQLSTMSSLPDHLLIVPDMSDSAGSDSAGPEQRSGSEHPLPPAAGTRVTRLVELRGASGPDDDAPAGAVTGVPGAAAPVLPEDPAMMYFTSGTTGTPKAAVHSHAGIMWNTLHQVADLEMDADESYLVVPSLSWGAGLHHVTLAMTWIGAENVLLATGGRTVDRIVDEIERLGIERALLVPTVLKELLRRPDLTARIAASPFRRATSGAEPLYDDTVRALHAAMPQVAITQAYGMTEFPLFVTLTTAQDAIERPGTAGRPSSIVTLGVVDETGTVVPRGSGEVAFRSPATTTGYHHAPEKNAETFLDGWFRTGDLGTIDDDGYLTIVGRAKDMIITGGLNIYPREIESVLSRIPGVLESAVIPRPDERWGEIPVAVVVVAQDSPLDTAAVLDFCEREISTFKRPKDAIVRREPLPKTVTGKIVKRRIEDPAAVSG